MYSPLRAALKASADSDREVATGADDGPTGWADVDAKLGTLRRRVRDMDDTPDDARAVGLQRVSVLEALGRAAFETERSPSEGEEVPHPNDAKTRLGHFLRLADENRPPEQPPLPPDDDDLPFQP